MTDESPDQDEWGSEGAHFTLSEDEEAALLAYLAWLHAGGPIPAPHHWEHYGEGCQQQMNDYLAWRDGGPLPDRSAWTFYPPDVQAQLQKASGETMREDGDILNETIRRMAGR